MDGQIMAVIPVRIVSEPNMRGHWGNRARRSQAHRDTARWALAGQKPPSIEHAPISILLERVGHGRLDDDNLAAGFKAVRDGVADWLRIDDGDKRLRWSYAQRVNRKLLPHATVTVSWKEGQS